RAREFPVRQTLPLRSDASSRAAPQSRLSSISLHSRCPHRPELARQIRDRLFSACSPRPNECCFNAATKTMSRRRTRQNKTLAVGATDLREAYGTGLNRRVRIHVRRGARRAITRRKLRRLNHFRRSNAHVVGEHLVEVDHRQLLDRAWPRAGEAAG